jgi:hypothetical protein
MTLNGQTNKGFVNVLPRSRGTLNSKAQKKTGYGNNRIYFDMTLKRQRHKRFANILP